MSRSYEVMFILRPDVAEEDVDKLIAGFNTTVTNGGGSIKTIDKMGRRKLAYMVRKFNDGNYVLLHLDADGAVVAELERRLRVSEPVIKFLTVRMDEEEKRLAKVRALRATRRKLSAEPHQQPNSSRSRRPLLLLLLCRLQFPPWRSLQRKPPRPAPKQSTGIAAARP